jgi:hypothetical protein
MKLRFALSLLVLALARVSVAQPAANYINYGVTNNPQINATNVVNFGTINTFTSNPFETRNTVNFTNAPSGTINSDPGLHVETIFDNGQRVPVANFVNDGVISASGANFTISSGGFFVLTTTAAGTVDVIATNIAMSGSVSVGVDGLVRYKGNRVDLTRSGLAAGGGTANYYSGDIYNNRSNYVNATGVKDLYWGAGTNNVMTLQNGFPLNLPQLNVNGFRPPFVNSPFHEVVVPSFFGSFLTRVPSSFLSVPFQPFVWTNRFGAGGSNVTFQIVFLATNSLDTNLTTNVRFVRTGNESVPVVQFSFTDTETVSGVPFTSELYFSDRSAVSTNVILAGNLADATFRPINYDISRADTVGFSFGATTNQTINGIDFTRLGSFGIYSNLVVTNLYSAYSAQIGSLTDPNQIFSGSQNNPSLTDPTNAPGRVEILAAEQLDMTFARVRAENTIILRTSNYVGSAGVSLDAPIVYYDLQNMNTTLNLTNFIPPSVKRFNGFLNAWSGTWSNTASGVNADFHVLILDASQMTSVQPVLQPSINVRGTNIVIDAVLNAGKSLRLDSPAVTFNASNQLLLSFTAIPNLVATNLPVVNYFTNLGLISIPSEGHFGDDRTNGWIATVNRGQIFGATHSFRSTTFENSGPIVASGGPITLRAGAAKLANGSFSSTGDLNIWGNDILVRNYANSVGTTLNITATNSLTDGGPGASNQWSVGFGFKLNAKPATGDLLGTTITSAVAPQRNVVHTWAGENRGVTRAGYSNNAALGKLSLSGGANSLLTFNGGGVTNRALYVDYLELTGSLATSFSTMLNIDTNFVIYFANANVSVDTLNGALGGRLRWVKDYAGANSSIDVILANGQSVSVNAALLTSTSVDSDADGIVNAYDLSPFDGVVLKNTVQFVNLPPLTARITWEAAAQTEYEVDVATTLVPPNWSPLLNYTNSVATNGPVTIQDTVPPGSAARYYRVLYRP